MTKRSLAGIFLSLLLIVFILVLPVVSFAQPREGLGGTPIDPPSSGRVDNPIKPIDSITGLIQVLLGGLIKIGMPVVALAIIYSGLLFVMARGNSEKLETAKQSLMYSLIGAAILLGSWSIAILISETVLNLGS